MSQSVLSPAAIEYPDSDGRPMAESEAQRAAIMYAIGALDVWFEPRADVYVSGDLLLYYEEGNPKASVAPDVFVVFGAPKHLRRTYKLWEEPKAPDFVLEVASSSTWEEDEGRKGRLYERLGVREYWQYDPTGEHLPVRLKGRRLVGGRYRPHPAIESLDGTLILCSETLGLELRTKGEELYFLDPVTGRRLLSHLEEAAARRSAQSQAEHESTARQAAEARAEQEAAACRHAESLAKRESTARQAAEARAEQEAVSRRTAEARADAAELQAERESTARRAADARVAELEALLQERHAPPVNPRADCS